MMLNVKLFELNCCAVKRVYYILEGVFFIFLDSGVIVPYVFSTEKYNHVEMNLFVVY